MSGNVKKFLEMISLPGRTLALFAIRLYQFTRPVRPPMCRYSPTCSEYAAQAIRQYGLYTGAALGMRRILRCSPLSPGGYDPVPRAADAVARDLLLRKRF